ncbi:helix-turn-helix domain-containing protein [Marinimicrobium locisalis]|uniref:helix-turn-helix domain-containing protein n=1 Tax=Marinimicrobium locisalis TaxID=546022 RepID=UPI003221CE7F
MNIIGPRAQYMRETQNLTQSELVARCNLLGWDISRGTLAKIEARVRRVTDVEVMLLAKALGTPVEQLFQAAPNEPGEPAPSIR